MSQALPFHPILALGLLALAACGEHGVPTQPEGGGAVTPAALSLAAAPNSWTPKATTPFDQFVYGYALGAAANPAGQSIVYTFGGASSDDGSTGRQVQAYNVAQNTWSGRLSRIAVFNSNGIGKIGSRLYLSGGYLDAGNLPTFERRLWAYDYSHDRLIGKADLPIFSAEGVTGVINGKLYVLPGACSGDGYPSPGYCAVEATRRFYRYDPATNTWASRRQAPHFHRQGAAAVIDGKLYVAAGLAGSGTPVTSLDVYDPLTNTWRTLASIPRGGIGSGGSLRGQFYVVLAGQPNRAYAYNRVTNQWRTRAAPPSIGSVTQVTLNGSTYLFTATGDKSFLYTP